MIDFGLEGRTVIVTGASGGLGEAMACGLGASGARVVLAARRVEEIERVAADIPGAIPVRCDVAERADRELLVDTARRATGRIDGLVNNAGIQLGAPAEDESIDDFERVLDINLVAPFDLSRLCLPDLVSAGGAIVNITSVSGTRAFGRDAPNASYRVSKAALAHLTRELAMQWGARGVRVNAVSPGYFESAMTRKRFGDDLPQWLGRRLGLDRPGQGLDIAGTVQFLLSDAARYVTGQEIAVDGGLSIG